LCGAYQGIGAISAQWQQALSTCRGLCLPFLAGAKLEDYTVRLFERAQKVQLSQPETPRLSE
jgi:hypothetical protein